MELIYYFYFCDVSPRNDAIDDDDDDNSTPHCLFHLTLYERVFPRKKRWLRISFFFFISIFVKAIHLLTTLSQELTLHKTCESLLIISFISLSLLHKVLKLLSLVILSWQCWITIDIHIIHLNTYSMFYLIIIKKLENGKWVVVVLVKSHNGKTYEETKRRTILMMNDIIGFFSFVVFF